MVDSPVFFDPTGRRKRWFARVVVASSAALLVVSIVFFSSLLEIGPTFDASFGQIIGQAFRSVAVGGGAHAAEIGAPLANAALSLSGQAEERDDLPRQSQQNQAASSRLQPGTPLTIGFYANWGDNSYSALQAALPHLDWIIPAWLSLQGPESVLTADVDGKALDLVRRTKPGATILPMLQNALDGQWDGIGLQNLLADPLRRASRIREIVALLDHWKFSGITIDFEQVPKGAQVYLKTFLAELRAAFNGRGWTIALAVPFDDNDWNYQTYARLSDYLILMAYDQHWEQGTPGSIAAQKWFQSTLRKRMTALDPRRTIVALGNYGYDWVRGQTAEDITFQETMVEARNAKAKIIFDQETGNPYFTYVDEEKKTHEVWFLDGVTAFDQVHAADAYRPIGYALWRVGSEDPSIWSVLGRPYGAPAPAELTDVAPGRGVDLEGNGELLRVASPPQPGVRAIGTDSVTGQINSETYRALPISYVVQRLGSATKRIALTFDDGPDPTWTPKILDILRDKHVHATFFIIGEHALANPDLVRRMIAEGHDVGNHTYTHPNISLLPPVMTRLELNATQRLFESLTNRSLRLFRPPYLGDAEPTTATEVQPIEIAQGMGYLTVGLHVDPDDWQRPPAQEIVDRVLKQIADPDPDVSGNIVLLHDAGGDRSQTVAALPGLIDALRRQGYELVGASELAGLTRDQAMPLVDRSSAVGALVAGVFFAFHWLDQLVFGLFVLAIALGVARVLFLCGFALINAGGRRSKAPVPGLALPLQSVLIPAYNEAKVIAESISRVLASDYANLEVIVVDDGSSDGTSEIVRTAFVADRRVRLITTANGGKARALNLALQHARGSVVVALDADTQFKPDTISRLVRWFSDERVGAVAGNAKVGNRINAVTCCQALEYITAQNLERRALAALGCITVVPGAVGAWRKAALDAIGGFPTDTVAEDQDLTIAVQKKGYEVVFDPEAIAYTEAPDTVAGLAKQRFRWAFGTLQCLWKHRAITLRPRFGALGMVAFPQVFIFQVLFSILSPLIDIVFIWQILASCFDYINHGDQSDTSSAYLTGVYYLTFVLTDIAGGVVAFLMEKGERWRLMWFLVLQRYGYRQLVYYVVIRAVLAAIRGMFVGWGKLERKATVAIGVDRALPLAQPPAAATVRAA